MRHHPENIPLTLSFAVDVGESSRRLAQRRYGSVRPDSLERKLLVGILPTRFLSDAVALVLASLLFDGGIRAVPFPFNLHVGTTALGSRAHICPVALLSDSAGHLRRSGAISRLHFVSNLAGRSQSLVGGEAIALDEIVERAQFSSGGLQPDGVRVGALRDEARIGMRARLRDISSN